MKELLIAIIFILLFVLVVIPKGKNIEDLENEYRNKYSRLLKDLEDEDI